MKRIFCLLLLLGCLQVALKAAHIIGGEITYECLGVDPDDNANMIYRFTLIVYRDCQGGGAPFDMPGGARNAHVTYYRGDDLSQELFTQVLDAPVINDINPDLSNPCVIIPPNVCVEEGVYTWERSLPVIDATYYIVYQRCCRNGSINNILNPGNAGSSYSVEITPTAQTTCNNSPVFKSFPPLVICVNEELVFDHSATDAEGDQLVYSFCSPVMGGSINNVAPDPDTPPPWDEVNFVLPTFSALNPLGGNPQVTINTNTGLIQGVPNIQGQYVVGICVEEYRNGVLLSTLQRDFQFNVTFCELTVNADLNGVDAGATYSFNSCVDSTIQIINQSTDINFIDEYYWEFDIPDASGLPLSYATRDVTITFPGPGFYTGIMILNPGTLCTDTADIEVTIAPPINPQFRVFYDTCVAGPVSFTDLTNTPGIVIEEWDWRFGDGNVSTAQNTAHLYEEPGDWNVVLNVTDTIGCMETVSETVNWFPAPPLIIVDPSSDEGCPPLDITLQNLSSPIDETYEINWDFGDGNTAEAISPDHVYEQPGTYTVVVDITSPIGCFTTDTFRNLIFVDSFPVADFTFDPPNGISNFNPTVQFTDQSKHILEWDWTFGNTGSSIIQNPSYTFPDTGLQIIQLVGTHFYGCTDTIQQVIDVVPKITYFMPNAFTPNGDGKNEGFRGGGFFRGIRNFTMRVFDRWGSVVYEANNPDEEWNGRHMNTGQALPTGVYVYRVQFTGPRGQPNEFRGFATLFR
ncbi:MAG: PKD domain-containing protein [Bacteroidota bacterium]